jgi:hypothetical protein
MADLIKTVRQFGALGTPTEEGNEDLIGLTPLHDLRATSPERMLAGGGGGEELRMTRSAMVVR